MISILQEPVGESYKKLIEYAGKRSSQFVLVLDLSYCEIKESCFKILAQLEPYLIKKIKHNNWPGTGSYGSCSLIYYFQCSKASIRILQNSVDSLYQWNLPKFPADLSFIDENNNEWFVSVTHEKICWLYVSKEEKQEFLKNICDLQWKEEKSKTIEQLLQNKESTYLSLNHRNLSRLPEEIAAFEKLQVLSIEDDTIVEIPEFIGSLTNLEALNIAGRKITSIPSSIFYLPKLNELKIQNTAISVIPKAIGNLKNLRILEISNNEITTLPDEICELKKLWVLFAAFNKIEKIPRDIGKLTNLWYMGIHNNKIKELPESIKNILELKYISIFNNEFKNIQCEIEKFNNMECARVDAEFESFLHK
ncbi:leucine-rich repeat domain-containing protein [Clostridium sp. JS66]|uniref:leucine-rich repeat domain-containing protein n=1 Tax=Clostridium sp. JS66 TaxID=3064705 RepID=UPI00298E5D59|nr:leucine-rich repeat domain-containing protein [Clostridium sp. JS66]WPC39899.1 leucine-rich repeat domain-containing protein [Clostridium sp. JS66]